MKLIKTKLLLNHNHNSAAGIATASHIDFCRYQVRRLKSDELWSLNEYGKTFSMFIYSFFNLLLALLLMPVLMVTNGLILYPFWVVIHIIHTKKIIKKFGADRINASAEKLVKEKENEH